MKFQKIQKGTRFHFHDLKLRVGDLGDPKWFLSEGQKKLPYFKKFFRSSFQTLCSEPILAFKAKILKFFFKLLKFNSS